MMKIKEELIVKHTIELDAAKLLRVLRHQVNVDAPSDAEVFVFNDDGYANRVDITESNPIVITWTEERKENDA